MLNLYRYTTKLLLLTIIATFLVAQISPKNANANDLSERQSSCSKYYNFYEKKYKIPHLLLKSISTHESGKWNKNTNDKTSWPWTINVRGKGYYFPNKKSAVKAVKQFQAKGISSIDVGCMQVNLRYHKNAFKTVEQALEPKYNVEYAAKLLKRHQRVQMNWKKAVAHYHSNKPKRGLRYSDKVFHLWEKHQGIFETALLR